MSHNTCDAVLDRRGFLRWSALTAGSALLVPVPGCTSKRNPPPPPTPPPAPQPTLGTIIGPGQYTHEGKRVFVLAVVDLDRPRRKTRKTEVAFFAHGVVPNPVQPTKAVLFEKIGKGSCEVDLVSGKVLRTLTTTADRKFYGHGAFTPDGKTLFATETITEGDFEGVIAVRDGKTFELLGNFPTFGAAPHDCKLVDDGKTLVITNGGNPLDGRIAPSVTYVDVVNRKLLEKVEFSTSKINAGHLALTAEGSLAVVSAPREGLPDLTKQPGGVSLRPAGTKTLNTMTLPAELVARLHGEVLSVCIHEPSSTVAATCPLGDLVTFWDLKKGSLRKSFEIPRPRGVSLTLDQKQFVVTFGQGEVVLLDADSLEAIPASKRDDSFITGSHIIAYDLPA